MIKRPLIGSLLWMFIFSDNTFAEKVIEINKEINPNSVIELDIYDGDINIEGWTKPTITITGTLASNKDELVFDKGIRTSSLILKEQSQKDNTHKKATLKIYVPEKSQIEGKFVSANIKSSGVLGGSHLESVNGNIEVSKASDNILLKTASGKIELSGSNGDIELRSISGSVKAINNEGQININTVSGNIHVDISDESRVRVTSTGGTIATRLSPDNETQIKMKTLNGNISASLKGAIDAHIELSSGPNGKLKYNNKAIDSNNAKDKEFNFGEAEARISLRTLSGTINLDDSDCSTCKTPGKHAITQHALEPEKPVQLKLPRKSANISILGNIALPTSEDDVPWIELKFLDKKNKPILTQTLSDSECTGEYSSTINYYRDKAAISRHYLETALPWPDDIELEVTTNVKKDGKYYQLINYLGETVEIPIYRAARAIEVSIKNGTAELERFELVK